LRALTDAQFHLSAQPRVLGLEGGVGAFELLLCEVGVADVFVHVRTQLLILIFVVGIAEQFVSFGEFVLQLFDELQVS
jgi:hypothetical protein